MQRENGKRGNLVSDLVAGLTTGISNIPDAMATAVLAGANPVSGLYATMIGTPVGALLGSSVFLTIATTSALGITAGSALEMYTGSEHDSYLFSLTLLAGVLMILAGLFKAGRLIRFISNSVMIGFLTGVSTLVVLSQIGDFTGYSSSYSNKVVKAIDTLFHLNQIDLQTTAIGILTVIVILIVDRTRLKSFSMLVGILVGSLTTLLLGWQNVQIVSDVAVIPKSFPLPKLPDLSVWPIFFADAVALAIIAMVQGAGISKGYPNPDGNYPDASRDFIGQGAANMAAGFFQGMPVGGSVGSTALNVSAGARSRWANIFSGLVVAAAVLLFTRLVSLVAIPSMAALLIVAGVQSIKREKFMDIWHTGWAPRLVMLVTLFFTLSIPIQQAVFIGVLLSILVYVFTSSEDIRLVKITPYPDGTYREGPPPAALPDRAITLLQVDGNLFFAAADRLEGLLPSPKNAERPVVILRLRGYESVSSTFVNVLERYAKQVQECGGRLMLAGVRQHVKAQLDRTMTTSEHLGPENVFVATEIIGAATMEALEIGEKWLKEEENGKKEPRA